MVFKGIINFVVGAATTAWGYVQTGLNFLTGDFALGDVLTDWGAELWTEAVDAYDYIKEIDSLRDVANLVNSVTPYYEIYERWKQMEDLEDFDLDLPAYDDFELRRKEMMEILATDPDQLSSVYDEGTLRKYGIDPESADAESMLRKRGARARYEQEEDAMARQFARSGVQGNAALAAAQAQLGIQGAAMDAQMGLAAEQMFTEQLSGLEDRYESVSSAAMNMQYQISQWELQKMQNVQKAQNDITKMIAKEVSQLATQKETEKAKQDATIEELKKDTGYGSHEGSHGGAEGVSFFHEQEILSQPPPPPAPEPPTPPPAPEPPLRFELPKIEWPQYDSNFNFEWGQNSRRQDDAYDEARKSITGGITGQGPYDRDTYTQYMGGPIMDKIEEGNYLKYNPLTGRFE